MSVTQERRGAVRSLDLRARVIAPSAVAGWLLVTAKALALMLGVTAGVGLVGGAMLSNVPMILLGWSLLSVAATTLFALSRLGQRR